MNIVETIQNLSKPTLALIVTDTEVKMNKKDVATKTNANPYVGARKVSTMLVELAPNYEKTVNNQREAEGKATDFESKDRSWGVSLGNGLVDNNGKIYVGFIFKESKGTEYLFEDQPVSKQELAPYIPIKKDTNNQGVEQTVVYRTVSLENIKSLEIVS